jgi:YihY family inner membrane protein
VHLADAPARKEMLNRAKTLLRCIYISSLRHNQLNNAAAPSFFFLLSLSPLLIFLVSLMALLPVQDLDGHILEAVSQIVRVDAMKVVGRLLASVFESNRRLLLLGILGAIWAGSTGFYAMIVALNSAYLATEERPLWKRQLVAIGLTMVVGAMLIASLFLLPRQLQNFRIRLAESYDWFLHMFSLSLLSMQVDGPNGSWNTVSGD